MRITMKGGVWKNSEDEILKAAVMKYGLNNWSRVASLLVRKSSKQCKARWYEWLDPSVKKTEWTRDEEEKLLHLAKLFPTQWRTIAPIVGRTAHQCFEHYERLLDQAQGKDPDDINDPRRYRPGDIDPHPETKPSRADPVDMDEDEKEMLAEARARLANTRGKKAKRKAREKQLEEARRLAHLQKRRELKAAGIQVGRRFRRRNEMDLSVEIPFEQEAPRGFHVVGSEETPEGNISASNVSLQQLEGKRRDAEEEKLRKDDVRKLKRLKADNFEAAQRMIDKLNDPQSIRKRTRLSLPDPQLSDMELEEILKVSADSSKYLGDDASLAEGTATAGLLPQAVGPLAIAGQQNAIRTPRRDNNILLEAENAALRRDLQTPLEGGATPVFHDTGGIGGHEAAAAQRTPNPLAAAATKTTGGDTPISLFGGSRVGGSVSSAAATPFNGSVANSSGAATGSESASGAAGRRAREALLKLQIRTSLSNLPEASNEIEVALPDEEDLMSAKVADEEDIEVDMEDMEAKKASEAARKKAEEKLKESKVLQQGLPRPVFADTCRFAVSYSALPADGDAGDNVRRRQVAAQAAMNQAEGVMHEELRRMILLDAVKRPISKAIRPPKNLPTNENENFSLDELRNADMLVKLESQIIEEDGEKAKGASEAVGDTASASKDYSGIWDSAEQMFMYVPKAKRYVAAHQANGGDKLESVMRQFDNYLNIIKADNAKADKLQKKFEVLTRGYTQRAQALLKCIEEKWKEARNLELELEVFEILSSQENGAMQKRREELEAQLQDEREQHSAFQREYSALQHERTLQQERALQLHGVAQISF